MIYLKQCRIKRSSLYFCNLWQTSVFDLCLLSHFWCKEPSVIISSSTDLTALCPPTVISNKTSSFLKNFSEQEQQWVGFDRALATREYVISSNETNLEKDRESGRSKGFFSSTVNKSWICPFFWREGEKTNCYGLRGGGNMSPQPQTKLIKRKGESRKRGKVKLQIHSTESRKWHRERQKIHPKIEICNLYWNYFKY